MMMLAPQSNSVLDYAKAYVSLGWRLCQIRPNSKAPILVEWNKKSIGPDLVEQAFGLSNFGIGLVHADSLTCAFDIDSMKWAVVAFAEFGIELNEMLEGYPRIAGRDGRDKIICRIPQGLDLHTHKLVWPAASKDDKPITVFELRANGGQDVLPPSIHPDTREPYRWVVSPFQFEQIPLLPDVLLTIWREWDKFKPQFEDACPWKQKGEAPKPVVRSCSSGHSNVIGKFNSAYSVESMLEKYGYIKKGKRWLAPSSSTGIPGVVVFEESGKCFSHHASDVLNDKFSHDAFDLFCMIEHHADFTRAVRAAARELGILHEKVQDVPLVDTSAMLASFAAKKDVVTVSVAPDVVAVFDAKMPIPELQAIADWMGGLFDAPTPSISMAGSIGLASVVGGRIYRSTHANWPSMLIVIAGSSGIGKNYIKIGIERLLVHSDMTDLIAGDFYTHQSAMYWALNQSPCHICVSDEFGENFLEARKNNNSNKLTVFKAFKKVYSDADHIFKPESYAKGGMTAKQREADRTDPICNPALTLLGLTTPLQFYSEIKLAHIESGLMNRFVIINADKGQQIEGQRTSDVPPPELIREIKRVRQMDNIHAHTAFNQSPVPVIVRIGKAAHGCFDSFLEYQKKACDELEEHGLSSMPMRWRENAMRLATALAPWRNHSSPFIDADIAEFAVEYVKFHGKRTIQILGHQCGENDHHQRLNAVLSFIRLHPGCTDGDICRAFRQIKPREMSEIKEHLLDGDLASAQRIATAGRPRMIWTAL